MKDTKKKIQWYKKLEKEPDFSHEEVKIARKQLNFEKHIEDSYRWIHEVAFNLGDETQFETAYQVLRVVLTVLRDRMTPEEVFQLSAQLPIHIRGIFFEGYNLKDKPQKYHAEEFLKRIEETVTIQQINPQKAFQAVLGVLYSHITLGELEDIYVTLPKGIRNLWDEALK
ncbi:MAG TPA: DUF2267 domain-containing protein [Balneolaceae bacterium]|nr:DUF2267 domain-containing protein [Balneolaceae bacterium]